LQPLCFDYGEYLSQLGVDPGGCLTVPALLIIEQPADNSRQPGLASAFSAHADQLPTLTYRAKETGITGRPAAIGNSRNSHVAGATFFAITTPCAKYRRQAVRGNTETLCSMAHRLAERRCEGPPRENARARRFGPTWPCRA